MSKALDLIKILESDSEISIIKNKWDIYSNFLKVNKIHLVCINKDRIWRKPPT